MSSASGTVLRTEARGFRLRKTAHKVALTGHVLGSVGWFGVAVVVAFGGITATATTDPTLSMALYRAMHASLWVSIPTGAIAVGTGVVLSLGTAWGLVRHWWVVAKIAISVAVIVTDAVVISSATASAASTGTVSSPLRDGTVAHCIVLAIATGLSIFKPKGRTRRGVGRSLPDASAAVSSRAHDRSRARPRRCLVPSRPSRFDLVLAGVVLVAQVGFTVLAASHQPERRGIDALAIALLAAGPVALVWRRRFPVAVYAVSFAATLAYSLIGYGRGPIFFSLVVAFVTVVNVGHRVVAWTSIVVGYFAFEWARHVVRQRAGSGLAGGPRARSMVDRPRHRDGDRARSPGADGRGRPLGARGAAASCE